MKDVAPILACALSLVVGAISAHAQDEYPIGPVKLIVPYAPGGATDITARVLGDKLKDLLGRPFIVENRPGAAGIIAIEEMARSKPDGYTLMIGNVTTNAITPIVYRERFSISYEKDVLPIMRLNDVPGFLAVTARDFPPKTLTELIDYVKQHPGKVNYGTVGVGSYPDYDMALFAKRAGNLEMLGVPNKAGASGVMNDMLNGTSHATFINVASAAGMIRAGELRALATVNYTRLPDYPDVPTMQEAGFPGVGTLAWQALFAPAGTPNNRLEILHAAMLKALQEPSVVATFDRQHFNIVPTRSLAEARPWLAGEMDRWRKITDEVKIELPPP